jgi:hypothetical protein
VKNILLPFMTMFVGLVLMPGSAAAHHGYAAFDRNVEITFTGTVIDFHWTNPHCIVEFDVKDDKGQVHAWKGELTSPSHLAPRGWSAATLEAGDKITITGHPGKNNVPSMWVTKIGLPDGKELKVEAEN